MLKVKVCGLVARDDVLCAAEIGADALGFVFVPGTPRTAEPDVMAAVVPELPPQLMTVGVFRDQPIALVREIARECRLSAVQLHGGEDAAYLKELEIPAFKAISAATADPADMVRYQPGPIVLDSDSPGSGLPIDWLKARAIARETRVILAGGLHPGNVTAAIRVVRPWGVDASSGLESSPGRKDPHKMRAFVSQAKKTAREAGGEDEDV